LILEKNKNVVPPLYIKGEQVEVTETYRYLGLTIDNKLTWNSHLDSLLKKANQRLYFLRKLRSFNVDKSIMVTFYSSTVDSIFLFGIVCYGGNISKYQILKINRTIKRAGKIINQQLPLFEDLYTTSAVKKAKEIIEDTSHILNKEYETSDRSGRLLSKRSRTNRYKNSFVPVTTRLLQSSL